MPNEKPYFNLKNNKPYRISYIFASRSRPDKFFLALDNIHELSYKKNFEIIAALDSDDTTMNNPSTINKISKYPNVKPFFSTSTGKINAINREVKKISDETNIICCHSDDMVFVKRYFDLEIFNAFSNFSGLVHFPDQITRHTIPTYAMLSRDYLEVDNFIYHPDFISVYADNFQKDLAVKRNRYKFVDSPILEHRHFYWGYGKKDKLLDDNENPNVYAVDKETYLRLKKEFDA